MHRQEQSDLLSPAVTRGLVLVVDLMADLLQLEQGVYNREALRAMKNAAIELLRQAGVTHREVSRISDRLKHAGLAAVSPDPAS